MSGIVFWMSITRYSARWITLCEERRRTRRRRQQPQLQAVERLRNPEHYHWSTQAANERIPRYDLREPRYGQLPVSYSARERPTRMHPSIRSSNCGTEHQRDENSVVNLFVEGLRSLAEGRSVSACGGTARPNRKIGRAPVKQETSLETCGNAA